MSSIQNISYESSRGAVYSYILYYPTPIILDKIVQNKIFLNH